MCRDYRLYLVDILIADDKIKRYTKHFDNGNDLLYSELEWDGVIREFEIIGEATNYLIKNEILNKNYRIIVDFRNKIIHGYFGIDEVIVWDVIKNYLPEFIKYIKNFIRENKINLNKIIIQTKKDHFYNKKVLEFLDNLEYELKVIK